MTLKEGVSELTNALASTLRPEAVVTGLKALAIEKIPPNTNGAAGRYSIKLTNGKTLKAHAVIVATPSYIAADLLKGQDIPLAENLASIPYVSTATVSLAYRGEDIMKPLNGFGFVIPRLEQRKIMASTWSSNKFFNRAPQNKFLIRCFVGGAGNEHLSLLSEPEIAAIVRDELRDIMGIKAEPIFTRVYRWEKSMPQYIIGHSDRLKRINDRLISCPGLFLAGSAYRGIGISDCIKSGERAARKSLEYLKLK